MFLSCVKRTGEFFGAGHIVDVLRGSNSQKVLKFGHEELSTYGIGTVYSAKQWRHIARQLIQKSLLLYNYEHGSLKLTPKAWEVMRGKEAFLGRMEGAKKDHGAVLSHLYQCLWENHPLRQNDFLMNSSLTEDQRQSVLSSFARLGTERLRPVFEDLNGTIPYEELKLLRLHHLCRDQ